MAVEQGPVLDHLHITVGDLSRAEAFYDRLLPLFGYDLGLKERTEDPEHEFISVEYHHRRLCLGFISPRSGLAADRPHRRRPGSVHHLALMANSPTEVDRLFAAVSSLAGARIVSEPRQYPEYAPGYYAFFFKDPEGTKWEVVHFDKGRYF